MIFEKMRVAVNSIMTKIFNQSFNQELSKGVLPTEKFIHYLQSAYNQEKWLAHSTRVPQLTPTTSA